MRRFPILATMLAASCAPVPPPPAPTPAVVATSPPTSTTPTVARPPAQPIPLQRFEPARRFAEKTKLETYPYHERRIGNVEGYFAPILLTADGGFLVVGTRVTRPGGKYQVGHSRPVVAKLDANGTRIWEHAYRARGFLDYEGASAVELDDGYVIYILSYVHPARGSVTRLVRIDRDGKVVWDLRLRGQGRENTPFPQNVRLHEGRIWLDGHIYKDSSDTAYGWKGTVSLDGKVLSDEVGEANPYRK